MKKIFLFLALMMSMTSFAQTKAKEASRDSLLYDIYNKVWDIQFQMETQQMNERYKLYKTTNIYTFLQLDTATGIIRQYQWSLDSDKEGYVYINSEDLSFLSSDRIGTFELYPTENMYQFLLLDKSMGRMWHVQWGMKISERWIRRM